MPAICFSSCILDNSNGDADISFEGDIEIPGLVRNGKWVLMIYIAADNDLEEFALKDAEEIAMGYKENPNLEVLVFIDRSPAYSNKSTGFGQDFHDSRIYRLVENKNRKNSDDPEGKLTRIDGGLEFPEITKTSFYEANSGDALTLKKFIRSCKSQYPAEKYALIIWNHGFGPRGSQNGESVKGYCEDKTSASDYIYLGEMTDALTAEESVELLAFDACMMGSVEVAYQVRPGLPGFTAKIMVASPANEWGYGFDYYTVLYRIDTVDDILDYDDNTDFLISGGSKYERIYNAYHMNAAELAYLIIEEQYDSAVKYDVTQTMSVYDLSKIETVKIEFDKMMVKLKDNKSDITAFHYDSSLITFFNRNSSDEWSAYPAFDMISFTEKVKTFAEARGNTLLSVQTETVIQAVDNAVLFSIAGKYEGYHNFQFGKNGLYFIFPKEDDWRYFWWYNYRDTALLYGSRNLYGKIKWCGDGLIPNNNIVENYYELLHFWYKDSAGGSSYDF